MIQPSHDLLRFLRRPRRVSSALFALVLFITDGHFNFSTCGHHKLSHSERGVTTVDSPCFAASASCPEEFG